MGFAFAISVALSVIAFPSTANFEFFNGVTKAMTPVGGLLKAHMRILRDVRPSSPDFRNYGQIGADGLKILVGLAPLEMMASASSLEMSYGRLDSGDAGEFRSLLKSLINVLASFEFFYHGIQLRKNILIDELMVQETLGKESIVPEVNDPAKKSSRFYVALHESYKPVGEYENQRRVDTLKMLLSEADEEDTLSVENLDKLMDLMYHRFAGTLEAADRAMEAITRWLAAANEFRIYSLVPGRYKTHTAAQQKCHEELVIAQAELRCELEKLEQSKWEEALKAESEFGALVAAAVCHGSVYGFSTQKVGTLMDRILCVCLSLDEERPRPELITPFTKSRRARARFNRAMIAADQDISNPDTMPGFVPYQRTQERNPEASPPRTALQLIGKYSLAFYNLLLNKHFLFWLRTAGFTVIMTIPQFCRPTALWFYENRIIWAVIMCPISADENPGFVIYGYVCKVIYTFLACVLAMVGWYISAGSGNGNHYGYAAVTLVIGFFLSFYRHFYIHVTPLPAIVLCASAVLVLGSSWQDAQFATISPLVGSGFHAAWVRMVTVVVGISMGFLASVFPRPSTGKSAVRKILARTLRATGNIHCDITKFGHHRVLDPKVRMQPRGDAVVMRFRAVNEKLASVHKLLVMLKYEPSVPGAWPKMKYMRLIRLERELLQLYYGLYYAFDDLWDPKYWVPIMISRYGWSSEGLSADFFSVIHMASGSLLSGRPLPRITPAQTTLRYINMLQEVWGISRASVADRLKHEIDTKRPGYTEGEEITPYNTNGSTHRDSFGGIDHILTHDGQLVIVGLMLIRMIYERIDEIMLVVKGLVGEDFDADPSLYANTDEIFERARLLI
jgi:hypothetical protein